MKHNLKTRGTLIKKTPLTETSLIVRWCTADMGIIKTVAKGARRPKSPFTGKLDLFFLCEIEVHPSKKSDLHILRELVVKRPRLSLRNTYLQTLAASYFVKLIDCVVEPEAPLPEIADLLERGLDYLEDNEATRHAVMHFEKQLAGYLGIIEKGVMPAMSIADQFGKLPLQRNELLERVV